MWSRRPDGELARRVPGYRKMMPFIMTTKGASAIYFKLSVDMGRPLAFLASPPESLKGVVTVTHLIVAATVRTLSEFPDLNRFVAGSRIYQRHGIYLSFSAKKAFTNEAPVVVVKVRFDPDETLESVVAKVRSRLEEGRSDRESVADKETKILLRLPRFLVRWVIRFLERLDYLGLLPRRFIEADVFYASAFLANLGSIGLDAAYHHLYEYGNIPLFATFGRIQPTLVIEDGAPVVRQRAEVKVTFDERVQDGFYAAQALARFKHYVENPEALLALPAADTAAAGPSAAD